jgi:hypothetical protein
MAAETRRVEIGFGGGQVAAARVAEDELKGLRAALEQRDGWHSLTAHDAELLIDLRQVVFVRVEGGAQAIGFSGT